MPGPHAQAQAAQAEGVPRMTPMELVAEDALHPDPEERPVLMHLGTLHLPFKVRQ